MSSMGLRPTTIDPFPPEKFVVKVFSELSRETVQERWEGVNVVLRLAMLAGLPMQLDATLNLLCDFAGEIARPDSSLLYFWDEDNQEVQLRGARGLSQIAPETLARGNILHLWTAQHSRPLLVPHGQHPEADAALDAVHAKAALVVPLFVSNRVLGSVQLFAGRPDAFSTEDAQLLWMFALVGENLVTREYANDGLIRFAFTDYLTGLKTRGYFEQQLEMEIKRSERKQSQFALLMIDIDFFKRLNDHYGHHAGDQVLRDIASILMKDMREVDTVARYGGEEFVMVLPDTGAAGARLVAERLRRGVEQAKFFAGSPNAVERLTISTGIAIYSQDGQFKGDLIERADAALYAAKNGGRNRVVLYSEIQQRTRKEVS